MLSLEFIKFVDAFFVLIIIIKRQPIIRWILKLYLQVFFHNLASISSQKWLSLDNKHNRENTRTNEDFLNSLEQTEHL